LHDFVRPLEKFKILLVGLKKVIEKYHQAYCDVNRSVVDRRDWTEICPLCKQFFLSLNLESLHTVVLVVASCNPEHHSVDFLLCENLQVVCKGRCDTVV
jgi:hypothetical protein